MNVKDAFNILGLYGEVTPEITKETYRRLAMQYHPDRNINGLYMMQLINVAYDIVKDIVGKTDTTPQSAMYGEYLNNAINAIMGLGLTIEICGAWIWVFGDTKTHKETLKNNGFKWAPKKQRWYYRPEDYKSYNRGTWSIDQIKERYGCYAINPQALTA